LINQLGKKNEKVIPNASKVIGKDLKRICKKYETKIASFQSNSSFVMEDESNFEQFNVKIDIIQFENSRNENNSTVPAFSLNFVGKNSISIPVLQLPDRYHASNDDDSKERPNERCEVPHINGIKEIIEIE
jgi:hypothetical protein